MNKISFLKIKRTAQANWLPIGVGVALVIALIVQIAQLSFGPRGDFPNHWEFGRRMAQGEPIYELGLNVVYPPLWSLAHAPLSVLPQHAAQFVVFPLFVAALALLLWTLQRLTREHFQLQPVQTLVVASIAVLLAGRFLFRDMVECGVNLSLVALSWLAIYFWTQRREWIGGSCLGLAIALKCTPLAFLGYFLWKRQWKMAGVTTLFTLLFTLLPALWMGPVPYASAMSTWYSYARRGLAEHDPNSGVLGDEKVQNLSLRPALAALLTPSAAAASPASSPPHGVLSPHVAGVIIKLAMGLFALAVAWQFRARVDERASLSLLWQCAIISLAMLLYSPITWTQHCVAVLPALYLFVLTSRTPAGVPRWTWVVLAGYVLAILILNRALLGRELSVTLLSYHVHAWSLLGLMLAALACERRSRASGSEDALAEIRELCNLPRQIPAHS